MGQERELIRQLINLESVDHSLDFMKAMILTMAITVKYRKAIGNDLNDDNDLNEDSRPCSDDLNDDGTAEMPILLSCRVA